MGIRHTDIAIVGGGLAGSIAAAMLSRSGFRILLIDPREVYPSDFRCEKLDGGQVETLEKTGLAKAVLSVATLDGSAWVARRGRLLDNKPSDQWGIRYDALVNTMRAQIADSSVFVHSKVQAISTSPERQILTLQNGEEFSARLVVLATGLNIGRRHMLGIERHVLSACHSVTAGFDMHPVGRTAFDFRALTYYPERVSDRLAYLTLFPIGNVMRANLMTYRDLKDPWLSQLRHEPVATLLKSLPRLRRLTGEFQVRGPVKVRPADLCATRGHLQPGIVLVGDAFATSCPAAGTGVGKVFTDVERLCNVYIPRWISTEGMGVKKISAFYEDRVKQASDRASLNRAYSLRSLSTDHSLLWGALRVRNFLGRWAIGQMRRARKRLSVNGLLAHPHL